MIHLPSELLIVVLCLVCADDSHDIKQKFLLTRVCAYWRAIALDNPSFWARIRIEARDDAALLPAVLTHSRPAALDVKLCWRQRHSLSTARRRAVIKALMAPEQRLRLRRLYVEYYTLGPTDLLLPLLGADVVFPALGDLEIRGPQLVPRLKAPSLRRLVLRDVGMHESLITSSLEYLVLKVHYESASLLSTVLRRCTALRHLEWDVLGSAPEAMFGDEKQQSLAPYLDILHVGLNPALGSDVLRFINQCRRDLDPITDVSVMAYSYGTLELVQEAFSHMGPLTDLCNETDQDVVIRDDVGRIRRLTLTAGVGTWEIPVDLWSVLATLHNIDESLRSLRFRSAEWNTFAAFFSTRPPTGLTEVYILLVGGIEYELLDDETGYLNRDADVGGPPRILCLPNIRRLVILTDAERDEWRHEPDRSIVTRVREILQHVECGCDSSSRVEVCIRDAEVHRGEALSQATQEILVDGLSDKWAMCCHCTRV